MRTSNQFNRLLFWHNTCIGQFAETKHMVLYLIRLVHGTKWFWSGLA